MLFANPSASQLAEFEKRGKCDRYEEPTSEDIANHDRSMAEAMERFTKAFPIIDRIKKKHRGEEWKGEEECPICHGKLHLSHAKYNGHVWGRCATEGCLSWAE